MPGGRAPVPDRGLVCLERTGREPSTHVVVFGPAGVGANWWNSVADALPLNVHLLAPRLPGRESRSDQPACRTADDAIRDVLAWLAPEVTAWRSAVVVGVCGGAVLAATLAVRLRDLADLPLDVHVVNPPSLRVHDGTSSKASAEQLRAELVAEGVLPPLVADNPAVFKFFEPMIRADLAVVESAPPDLPARVLVHVHTQMEFLMHGKEWLAATGPTRPANELKGRTVDLMATPADFLVPVLTSAVGVSVSGSRR